MKPTLKIIKLLFSLCVIFLGQSVFEQVPPYQHSTTKMLREFLEPSYYPTYRDEWVKYYQREEIPFYSMLTIVLWKIIIQRLIFNAFIFRKFSSFTAPKGVKKITYYLGNNLIDSTKATTHVFYFNKKTNLLDRELQYKKDSLGIQQKKEYSYKYEETEQKTIVKKLFKEQDSLRLISQYTYSKDKIRLLNNEFLSWDYQFENLIQNGHQVKLIKEFGRMPKARKVEFIYDDKNNVKKNLYSGAKNYSSNYDYDEGIYDFNNDKLYTHGWSKKNNWLSFLKQSNEKSKTRSFSQEIDLIFFNHYSFSYNDKGNSEILDSPNQSFSLKTMHSNNVYISEYNEKDQEYINPGSNNWNFNNHYYTNHKILLFDNSNKLSNVYIFNNYHISLFNKTSPGNFNLTDNTPLEYLFITKNKHKYIINHFWKEIPFSMNSVANWFWNDKFLSSFKNEESYLKNEQYTLELKPKKGLNEIYLIKDNKKLPLITIN